MAGRPRKPTEILKLTGNYRDDRHGARGDAPAAAGRPRMMAGLSRREQRRWRLIVESVPAGVYSRAEEMLLAAAVQWFTLYERQRETGDTDAAAKSIKVYMDCLGKLGATPVDRAKLQIPATEAAKVQVRKRG